MNGLRGVKVAAFDTRFSENEIESRILRFLVKQFGYAAKPISDRLKKREGELAIPPEGFFVEGTEGPLKKENSNELRIGQSKSWQHDKSPNPSLVSDVPVPTHSFILPLPKVKS